MTSSVGVARFGRGALALTVVLMTATLAMLVAGRDAVVPDFARVGATEAVVWTTLAVGFAALGALVCARESRNPIGPLLAAAGLCGALVAFSSTYAFRALLIAPGSLPAGEAAAWLQGWLWIGFIPLVGTIVVLLFPDGHLPSRRWGPVLAAAAAVGAVVAISFALAEGPIGSFPTVENPLGVLPRDLTLSVAGVALAGVVCSASLIVRYRASAGEQRQQLRWLALGAAASVLGIALEVTLDLAGVAVQLGVLAVLAGAGVAVLRYRLYDLDLVLNRALVYGLLSALLVLAYVGVVTGLGRLVDDGLGVSLTGTATVAALVFPLHRVLQTRVDRLLHGDRRDPYRALTRLGARLEGALDPDEVLPTVVGAIADGLKLPYVAIELGVDGDFTVAAAHGAARGEPLSLPLVYRGDEVGRLVVSPRSDRESLSAGDLRLLEDLARQAGVAAHAVALTADLRRSRERLVSAREEERRRLRRDLHDGLGPTFAAIALQVDAARSRVGPDPDGAAAALDGVGTAVREAIADIRRLVHDLRPPTLDEFGLVGALREQAARLDAGGVGPTRFEVDGPAALPPLPAAVEVAAYRIALEAMTNAARHAEARRCRVSLRSADRLYLEIADDGTGIAPDATGGVGVDSMRARAEELGGDLTIAPHPAGGTLVLAELPVALR